VQHLSNSWLSAASDTNVSSLLASPDVTDANAGANKAAALALLLAEAALVTLSSALPSASSLSIFSVSAGSGSIFSDSDTCS
jgi:ABC-type enterobactin transport system permease subunit